MSIIYSFENLVRGQEYSYWLDGEGWNRTVFDGKFLFLMFWGKQTKAVFEDTGGNIRIVGKLFSPKQCFFYE